MEDRSQLIKQYLQNPIVQKRIMENMQRAREEATVTISNAARIYGFTENQLRDWDDLLKPERREQIAEQDGKNSKRRQYTSAELNKLAIIRELLKEGKFPIGAIPVSVDELWSEVAASAKPTGPLPEIGTEKIEHVAIDQRVERTEKDEFWRYFVSQALRLSLLLICEDVPDTVAGIILPLGKNNIAEIVHSQDVFKAGYSLVGWLSESRSFYAFLESEPSFEVPSDFRVEHLANLAEDVEDVPVKKAPLNNVLVIVQRKANKAKRLILSKEVVEVVQRLLGLVYENVDEWKSAFERGVRNWMYQATDFASGSDVSDEVLNGLANIVVQLGGRMEDGRDRWRFCCILTPRISAVNSILPRQRHRLIVRAQSKDSPHKIGETYVTPDKTVIALSLRAYLSGQTVYRSVVVGEDETIALRDLEGVVGSAIAIPIEDEDGLTLAVIYVVSQAEEIEAFPENDRRLLRMVGRMAVTGRYRQLESSISKKIIERPDVADIIVGKFYSENKFTRDLEAILSTIQELQPVKDSEIGKKELSFICLDIDEQSNLGSMLGDRVTRNLSWELGERLHVQLAKLFGRRTDWHFYYIYEGRFYIILDSISQEAAAANAGLLREALGGEYKVDALRTSLDQPTSPINMLKIPGITIRLGVTSYKYWKLFELLKRYEDAFPLANVRCLITRYLDTALAECEKDSIVAWHRTERKFMSWPFQI